MGSDSFTPDHGVLIAKNMGPRAELAPFNWVIDAHPEDIDKLDFVRADGTAVPIGKGDYRQLADALFHAGTGPGVVSEYVDEAEPPALLRARHEARRGGRPVLPRRGALARRRRARRARRLARAGQRRSRRPPGRVAVQTFKVTNTGEAEDLIRVRAASAAGWATSLRVERARRAGRRDGRGPGLRDGCPRARRSRATLKLTATSETDASKSASSTATVTPTR